MSRFRIGHGKLPVIPLSCLIVCLGGINGAGEIAQVYSFSIGPGSGAEFLFVLCEPDSFEFCIRDAERLIRILRLNQSSRRDAVESQAFSLMVLRSAFGGLRIEDLTVACC